MSIMAVMREATGMMGSVPPPSYGIDADGNGIAQRFDNGPNSITLQQALDSGNADAWAMYRYQAKVSGLDPKSQHAQIMADLQQTLARFANQRRGVASNWSAFQTLAESTATARLNTASASSIPVPAAAANAPGAALSAETLPVTKALARATPKNPATVVGGAVGAGAGVAAGYLAKDRVEDKPLAGPWIGLDESGERRRDDICAPDGTRGDWIVLSRGNGLARNNELADYQRQIARTPDLGDGLMVEYRVTNEATGQQVDFDGCAWWAPNQALLEAKGGNASLYTAAEASRSQAFKVSVGRDIRDQATRQLEVVGRTHPVEYHVAEKEMVVPVMDRVNLGTDRAENFSVQHTPAER